MHSHSCVNQNERKYSSYLCLSCNKSLLQKRYNSHELSMFFCHFCTNCSICVCIVCIRILLLYLCPNSRVYKLVLCLVCDCGDKHHCCRPTDWVGVWLRWMEWMGAGDGSVYCLRLGTLVTVRPHNEWKCWWVIKDTVSTFLRWGCITLFIFLSWRKCFILLNHQLMIMNKKILLK